MNSELRKNILNEIFKEVSETKGEFTDKSAKLVDAYYNSISTDISKAIGEIDDFSAPFIVAALERYAELIKERFPGCEEIVKVIKELPNIVIENNK